MRVLICIGGLPATGKTTIARWAATKLGGVHLRIDTIEQAIADAGETVGTAGYHVGYAVAGDLLGQGCTVLAESVNPLAATRTAWRAVAEAIEVPAVDVEVICSDPVEHRRRAETRAVDIPGLRPPTWSQIQEREYEAWRTPRLVLDTAGRTPAQCVGELCDHLAAAGR